MPNLLIAATYGALLFTVLGVWFGPRVWTPALAVAVVLGYSSHVLNGIAGVWIVAFVGLCLAYERARARGSGWRRGAVVALTALGILALGVLLSTHVLPGFHNYLVLDKVVISAGAQPFTLYLNFDKTIVGIGILGLCYQHLLRRATDWARALGRAIPAAMMNVFVVALAAVTFGYLTWQPKWTPLFWIFAPVNLFFVCFAEEALFRGFIQREIALALHGTRFGIGLAIGVSAVLFGLSHYYGGPSYVVLAMAAGVGYATVYHVSRSIEISMLAHFTLNVTHFLLFTYPR